MITRYVVQCSVYHAYFLLRFEHPKLPQIFIVVRNYPCTATIYYALLVGNKSSNFIPPRISFFFELDIFPGLAKKIAETDVSFLISGYA
jgi:hypothetical protein